jgi:hypothetical protein
MLRVIGRAGSAVLETLLPGARAQACTDSWCEHQSGKGHRCCKLCTGGNKVCTGWTGAGTGGCSGVHCSN